MAQQGDTVIPIEIFSQFLFRKITDSLKGSFVTGKFKSVSESISTTLQNRIEIFQLENLQKEEVRIIVVALFRSFIALLYPGKCNGHGFGFSCFICEVKERLVNKALHVEDKNLCVSVITYFLDISLASTYQKLKENAWILKCLLDSNSKTISKLEFGMKNYHSFIRGHTLRIYKCEIPFDHIFPLLSDIQDSNRIIAVSILSKLKLSREKMLVAFNATCALLSDPIETVRVVACGCIGYYFTKLNSLQVLQVCTKHPIVSSNRSSCYQMGIGALVIAMEDEKPSVRYVALDTIQTLLQHEPDSSFKSVLNSGIFTSRLEFSSKLKHNHNPDALKSSTFFSCRNTYRHYSGPAKNRKQAKMNKKLKTSEMEIEALIHEGYDANSAALNHGACCVPANVYLNENNIVDKIGNYAHPVDLICMSLACDLLNDPNIAIRKRAIEVLGSIKRDGLCQLNTHVVYAVMPLMNEVNSSLRREIYRLFINSIIIDFKIFQTLLDEMHTTALRFHEVPNLLDVVVTWSKHMSHLNYLNHKNLECLRWFEYIAEMFSTVDVTMKSLFPVYFILSVFSEHPEIRQNFKKIYCIDEVAIPVGILDSVHSQLSSTVKNQKVWDYFLKLEAHWLKIFPRKDTFVNLNNFRIFSQPVIVSPLLPIFVQICVKMKSDANIIVEFRRVGANSADFIKAILRPTSPENFEASILFPDSFFVDTIANSAKNCNLEVTIQFSSSKSSCVMPLTFLYC